MFDEIYCTMIEYRSVPVVVSRLYMRLTKIANSCICHSGLVRQQTNEENICRIINGQNKFELSKKSTFEVDVSADDLALSLNYLHVQEWRK